ncbi:hypothetical protein MXM51_18390 [Pantoea stewartii]|uniref:XopAH/AvrB family type III secretion system effector n=1 Tax=Pantoea stewartii TaxID=66269 RepID=UPI002DC03AA2|nr:XopAH/AvrB family type III secretion system effector [Pantoea stewartii]MEB6536495.1 hypothetical protein [Pantoea stewartii]
MGCVSSKNSITSDSFRSYTLNSPDNFGASSSSAVRRQGHSPRYGELKGPQPSRLVPYQQSLVGVARWPDQRFNRDDSPHQMAYGQSFYNKTRELGLEIAEGSVTNFHELWDKAREWRANMASENAHVFREERDPNTYKVYGTPLAEQYTYVARKLADRNDLETSPSQYSLPPTKSLQIIGKINGEKIPLTQVTVSTDKNADRMQEPYLSIRQRGFDDIGEPNQMFHTSAEHVPLIMQHVEDLYRKAIDAREPDSKALNTLAEMHWWMAHAMPDKRGSAAKTELCVRSIAQARGMDLGPMKHGIVPDLEAMTMQLKDFMRKYESFFEKP